MPVASNEKNVRGERKPDRWGGSWRPGIWAGLAAWGLSVLLGILGAARLPNLAFYDMCHGLGPSRPQDDRIAVVYVGDYDAAQLQETYGPWPWRNREPHAVAVKNLTRIGARGIGFDVLFTAPSLDAQNADQALAEEIGLFGPVTLACLFRTGPGPALSDGPRSAAAARALETNGTPADTGDFDESRLPSAHAADLPFDGLLEASAAIGQINAAADVDGAIRRVPLLVRYRGRLYPSLALRVALVSWGVGTEAVELDIERGEIRIHPPGADVVRVPIDRDGLAWVRFERRLEDYRAERFWYVCNGEASAELLKGRLVIVGADVTGARDSWRTPVAAQFPGFLIQAQVLENILTGRFVTPVELDTAPFRANTLWLTLGLGLMSIAVGVGALRLKPKHALVLTLVGAVAPLVVSVLLLNGRNIWIPPTTASLSLLGAGVLGAGCRLEKERRQRRLMRSVYERYLAPRVLDAVLDNPALLEVGGARKELTVCFADIRGFVAFAHALEPEELTSQMNEYFTAMTEVIHRHEGTLDKFVGDTIMVFFGDPFPQPDHARRAVAMALDMQERLGALRRDWEYRGLRTFELGIGIATGYVTVGNFGSQYFTDYTVVGNTVHLAARLEEVAEAGQTCVSARTYHAIENDVEARSLGQHAFKGIEQPQEVYEVLGLR